VAKLVCVYGRVLSFICVFWSSLRKPLGGSVDLRPGTLGEAHLCVRCSRKCVARFQLPTWI
jgi:hypothetical protein